MRLSKRGMAIIGSAAVGATMILAPMAVAGNTANPTDAPADYYNDAEGKTGDELKAALHNIIDDNDQLSYSGVKDAIPSTDADPDNSGHVILLYTGRSEPNGGNWNREHVWAKSHGDFGTRIGPGTDLHHLRPTDPQVNSTRSNLDFDNGGEELATAPGNYKDSDSFEPRDEVKGDVARMIFYMDVRYEGDDGYPDLEVADKVGNGKNPLHGKLSTLLEWNAADPPSAFEKKRNDVIFEQFQHNRNPFIDNPNWANQIWGDGSEEPIDPDPTDPDPEPTDPTDPDPEPTDPTDPDPTDPPAECATFTSSGPTDIADNAITTSDVAVSDCDGKASSSSKVTVEITHPDRGELSIYLYAPDGTSYVLKRTGDSGANISETYTVNLSSETANGTWTLSVKDYNAGGTGTIDSWSITVA